MSDRLTKQSFFGKLIAYLLFQLLQFFLFKHISPFIFHCPRGSLLAPLALRLAVAAFASWESKHSRAAHCSRKTKSPYGLLVHSIFDKLNRLLHCFDILCVFCVNFDIEFLFNSHNDLE